MTVPSEIAKPRLLDKVRELIRIRHYSIRTEQAYLQWIRRFIRFHDNRHPKEMGGPELMAALTYGGGLRLLECLRWRLSVKVLDFIRGVKAASPQAAQVCRGHIARRCPAHREIP